MSHYGAASRPATAQSVRWSTRTTRLSILDVELHNCRSLLQAIGAPKVGIHRRSYCAKDSNFRWAKAARWSAQLLRLSVCFYDPLHETKTPAHTKILDRISTRLRETINKGLGLARKEFVVSRYEVHI